MGVVGVVEINQTIYEIVEDGDGDNVSMAGNSQCWGLTRYDKEKIYIHSDLTFSQKRRTLIHELCHAFLYEYANYHERYSQESVCSIMDGYAEQILSIVDRVYKRNGYACD